MTLLSAFTKASARPDLLILAFTALASPAFAEFSGQVVSILDGNTIEVLHNTRAERIHRNGIDCPGRASLGTSADHPGEEVRGTQMWPSLPYHSRVTRTTGASIKLPRSLFLDTSP